jgi:hypothetical protein
MCAVFHACIHYQLGVTEGEMELTSPIQQDSLPRAKSLPTETNPSSLWR